ncbi:Ubiquinone/menaquinone biosynthesis C-methylase UbiE [Nocardiopsis flavescens]|uniref:Ubiquinone/menaquinone biosynthesis C-methylase UbiE n=1 Tax=Nocardiopsis flavescens TaxID=758803 RepID=A0A1M6IGL0_9ACTN|nr:class I SAM-dependent methyltransferase [Nocardiopsis flavescens]SHJ33560.1 Ubiquinone/menaquinone biosynthesis C-methylase UbiE [Nocardiopsis flavescens]
MDTTTAKRDGAVTGGFDHASAVYDRLVAGSPGYHAHLRISARRLDPGALAPEPLVLDLGCGTGASTAALLHTLPSARIVGVDASEGMLDEARAKPWPDTVSFHRARVEELTPEWAAEHLGGPADAVFGAYLIRNCPDPGLALDVMRDLLRPGGRMVLHEYSVADSTAARAVWTAVCRGVIIPAGRMLSGDAELFRYLWRSVLEFDGRRALLERMRGAGLVSVASAPMPGWQYGITHTFAGMRPEPRR